MFRQVVNALVQRQVALGVADPRGAAMPQIDALRAEPSFTISYYMELAWANRARATALNGIDWRGEPYLVAVAPPAASWDHLVYAYLIENTRIYEIFGGVIRELAIGEALMIPPQAATHDWLRTTEELFYSYGVPFLASSIVSQIRPDVRATRRNAYYRMFGIDLNHGADGQPTYPYIKPPVANRTFIATFENFLRETWRAVENSRNIGGANPTDAASIADQALRLQNMMNERRGNTPVALNLAREEYAAVCAMQWLELAVADDTAVVQDLQVTAASPEERLRKLGDRVGIAAHANSHSYFILAPAMSTLLANIEQGAFNTPAGAQTLYLPANATNQRRSDIMLIIDHWSRVTGRSMKAAPVAASATVTPPPAMAAPRSPAAVPARAGAGNGAKTTVPAGQLAKV